jgi:DNA-binding response OmpR family regulator
MKSVLVVEDDVSLRSLFVELLSEEGFAPTAVASVDAALAAMQREHYETLLLDMRLGRRSASEVLEVVARTENSPAVVAMSASAHEMEIAARFDVPFVNKPFTIEVIVAALATARRASPPPMI